MLCKRYHKKKIQLQKKLVKKVLATLISSVYNDVFFQLETNYKNYATFAPALESRRGPGQFTGYTDQRGGG